MYAITQFATMVLDSLGTVRCCDAAADSLFGSEPGGLVGRDLSALVQGLPLRRSTPGYNLAYASFCAGSGDSPVAIAHRSDGSSLRVHVRFERAPRSDGDGILLVLDDLPDAVYGAHAAIAPCEKSLPCN